MPTLLAVMLLSLSVQSQNIQPVSTEDLIESQRYVFTAQSAQPLRGRQVQLTSIYTLWVSRDTVTADLPFFGRAFAAPLDPDKAGIHFSSTDFTYAVMKRKKGGWDIQIRPKDNRDISQLFLSVFANGNASLQVSSRDRENISYQGYISAH